VSYGPDLDALLCDPIIVRAFRFAPKCRRSLWHRQLELCQAEGVNTLPELMLKLLYRLDATCTLCGVRAKLNMYYEHTGLDKGRWPLSPSMLMCDRHSRMWLRLERERGSQCPPYLLMLELSGSALNGQAERSLKNKGKPLKQVRDEKHERKRLLLKFGESYFEQRL